MNTFTTITEGLSGNIILLIMASYNILGMIWSYQGYKVFKKAMEMGPGADNYMQAPGGAQ